MKTLAELQKEARQNSVTHGFDEDNIPTCIALMHSELSEALESYRSGEPLVHFTDTGKPEGLVVEYADVVIRIMSHVEKLGYDLQSAIQTKMAYNATRPFKHGGKKF